MSSKTATSASLSLVAEPPVGGEAKPKCSHFGSCGGCQLQHFAYEAQLALKRRRVESLLSPLGIQIGAVHPSPDLWYYRNKMEFSFGDVYPPQSGGPTLKLGLKPRGKWYDILDLQECFLLSPETPALLKAVRAWSVREGVPPYNSHRSQGVLRHLVVREAKNGPDRLVLLVTTPAEIPTASLVESVCAAYPATSVLWGVNGKISDTAISDKVGPVFGQPYITETLRLSGRELSFRVSPHSFFQTNTRGAEVLYGLLRRWVKELAPQAALDLFCGGGGIALSLADVCGKVYGAELNASAIEDARQNAKLNGIDNVDFYSGEVQTLLPAMLALGAEVVVLDPPRAGLHPSALPPLLEKGPARLIYVSCNPEALARDLAKLMPTYVVRRAEIVDLFPHTEHVETVVELKRDKL